MLKDSTKNRNKHTFILDIFQNGADVKALDVDGCLAADLCSKDSETRTIIKQYMYDIGE